MELSMNLICTQCFEEKPASEFYLKNGKPKRQCKECDKIYQREYRKTKYDSDTYTEYEWEKQCKAHKKHCKELY